MDLGLTHKVALVTGGSSGLGRATADLLAAEGAHVAVNGRDPARAEAAAADIRARHGGKVLAFPADVSQPSQVERLVGEVAQAMGSVDILLCNAGGPPPGPFESHSAQGWQQALELNLLSTVHLCRSAVPLMRRRGWGRILCVASVAARQPASGLILSTTARAGVLGFAKALADEVAAHGITVNVLCPGYLATDRLRFLMAERARREQRPPDDELERLAATVPAGRIGTPEEFAAVAVFLASEAASYLTGAVLSVDGGVTRSIV